MLKEETLEEYKQEIRILEAVLEEMKKMHREDLEQVFHDGYEMGLKVGSLFPKQKL